MSLATLGTVANILGVITPAKDVGEVIKSIAESVEEVKENRESRVYWDRTLQSHAKEVYSVMARCKEEGATDSQTRSLFQLIESLILLRKDLTEVGQQSFLKQWYLSGEIKRQIKNVEKKMKRCQDMFVTDTLSSHTSMLARVDSRVGELIDKEGRHHIVEQTTIRWKVPGKADIISASAVNQANLAQKTYRLIQLMNTKAGLIQELLSESAHKFDSVDYCASAFPVGDPEEDCEDASHTAIYLFRTLQDVSLDSASLMKCLDDMDDLSYLLCQVGLKKEARQVSGVLCRIWMMLASRVGSEPVYSRLAHSLYNFAVDCISERQGQDTEALPLVEKAIQIYRRLGESSLPRLARCLHFRAKCLCLLRCYGNALESAEESVGILRRLVHEDLSLYGHELVLSLLRQSEAYFLLSRYEDTLQCSSEALQWLSKLSPQYRQIYPFEYAWASWNICRSYYNLRDYERAMEFGERVSIAYYQLIKDRPLFYGHTLSNVLQYCSWFDGEYALPFLEKSLTVCLTVDTTFTAPQFADTLDRRADIFMSNKQYGEALQSYDQAVDIRRRLVEEEGAESSIHFSLLLKTLRLRALCLLSLHRQYDAASSLSAVQDVIASRLKSTIDGEFTELIIEDLKEQHKLLGSFTNPECTDLIALLKSYRKVLSAIHDIKFVSQNETAVRSDFGILLGLECNIYLMLEKKDVALLSIDDAVNFYRSLHVQKHEENARIDLVAFLALQARCCVDLELLERALNSMYDAIYLFRIGSDDTVESNLTKFIQIINLYPAVSYDLIKSCSDQGKLYSFLTAAIKILRLPTIATRKELDPYTRLALAWQLASLCELQCQSGLYQDAAIAAIESADIRRKLVAEGIEGQEKNLATSLYWSAKSLLAHGDASTALTSIEEAIDVQKQIEDKDRSELASHQLSFSLSLRAEILYRLGRAVHVTDALSVTWTLKLTNPHEAQER